MEKLTETINTLRSELATSEDKRDKQYSELNATIHQNIDQIASLNTTHDQLSSGLSHVQSRISEVSMKSSHSAAGVHEPGPSYAQASARDDIQSRFKILKKTLEAIELPPEFTFHDSGIANINQADKSTYRVIKNSSSYAETLIKLVGTINSPDCDEGDLAKLHMSAEAHY